MHWFNNVSVFISARNALPTGARTPVNCTVLSPPQQPAAITVCFIQPLFGSHKRWALCPFCSYKILIKTCCLSCWIEPLFTNRVMYKLHHFRGCILEAIKQGKPRHHFPKCDDCVWQILRTMFDKSTDPQSWRARASNALYVKVLDEMCLQCLSEAAGADSQIPEISCVH